MRNLSGVLIGKIIITIFFWCIPLLLVPADLLIALEILKYNLSLFIRLLGMAYTALIVGYIFGLRNAMTGIYPAEVVWVGIVSNGGACLLLTIAAIQGVWCSWSGLAQGYMWGSLIATGAITTGLIVFGPLGMRA